MMVIISAFYIELGMQRKYIHKNEQDDPSNLDPLDYVERKIKFQKQPSDGTEITPDASQNPQNRTTNVSASNQADRSQDDDSKLEAIKKIRFNDNLKFLRGDSAFSAEPKEVDMLGKEFESDKIGQEVNGLLYQFEKQKMSLIQRQIQEEKTLVKDLNQKIEQNIAKFVNLESRLKGRQEELEFEVKLKTKKLVESERLAAIGELSSRLAHDLKNPLSVLKMFVDLLRYQQKNGADEKFVHKLEAANAAIFRMTHQIDNVLDFVRDLPLSTEQATVHELINMALPKLPLTDQIVLDIQQQDASLPCDKKKMYVVFVNIMLNSIQAINGQGTISIRFFKNGDHLVIEFADSGPGIPSDILPRIFDPLFTTKQQGTGLGLATCKGIVEQHGGKVYAKNNPTTFSVVLPISNKG